MDKLLELAAEGVGWDTYIDVVEPTPRDCCGHTYARDDCNCRTPDCSCTDL
jgi:hypothetical protein